MIIILIILIILISATKIIPRRYNPLSAIVYQLFAVLTSTCLQIKLSDHPAQSADLVPTHCWLSIWDEKNTRERQVIC